MWYTGPTLWGKGHKNRSCSLKKREKAGKKDLTELVPSWYTGPIMRNREDNMKKLRFTVEKNYSERDSEWFYDVVDHHMLRDRRVVSYYTAEDTDNSGLNYGRKAAQEEADYLNDKYGYDALYWRTNMKNPDKYFKEAS